MFQKASLIYGNLVEFVQVDKEKSSQGTLRFLFAAEVQAVGIAETEFGRQDVYKRQLLISPNFLKR